MTIINAWGCPVTATKENLNAIMDFDHVIQVHDDGTISDDVDVWAPELSDGELDADGWELLNGYSGQDRYSGPIMHESEFLGDAMARDILATPGVYVALVSYVTDDDSVDGWAVARMSGGTK